MALDICIGGLFVLVVFIVISLIVLGISISAIFLLVKELIKYIGRLLRGEESKKKKKD